MHKTFADVMAEGGCVLVLGLRHRLCSNQRYSTFADAPIDGHLCTCLPSLVSNLLQQRQQLSHLLIDMCWECLGACAMTTELLDNKICTFKIVLSWRFPRKQAFLDDFPLCPQGPAPSKAKILFLLSSRCL